MCSGQRVALWWGGAEEAEAWEPGQLAGALRAL